MIVDSIVIPNAMRQTKLVENDVNEDPFGSESMGELTPITLRKLVSCEAQNVPE